MLEVAVSKSRTQAHLRNIVADELSAQPEIAMQLVALAQEKIRRGALGSAALTRFAEQVAPYTPEQQAIATKRLAFVEKHRIKMVSDHEVNVALGNTNRIDFLREAQALALALHGQNAVWPERLKRWAKAQEFHASPGGVLSVDGNVPHSTNLTREQQEQRGWCDVPLEDLALAHVATFAGTGQDLFGGNVVRAPGGALKFCEYGLYIYRYSTDSGFPYVAASRTMRSQN